MVLGLERIKNYSIWMIDRQYKSEMERNKKYKSNHFSQGQFVLNNDTVKHEGVKQSRVNQRQSHAKSYHQLNVPNKENCVLPYPNQYSFLNKYKKLDQLIDMENHFKILHEKNKQKRFKKLLEIQLEKQRLILPSIHEKQNQKLVIQQNLLKIKLQSLEEKINRIDPLINYNMLPPINYHRCQCNQQMMCFPHQFNSVHPHYLPNQPFNAQNNPKQRYPLDKERRKKLLRKFRIVGIAMYFLTLFPHYSYFFGHFKLKLFLEKYLVEKNKLIRSINEALIQKFKDIPLYEEIRLIHDQYEEQKQLQKKSKQPKVEDPKIKISNDGNKENYVINLGIFKKIVFMVIKIFDQMVQTFEDETLEFFGIGTLNNSYYADQTFAIEQMPFIYCHPEKNTLQVTPNQEKALFLSSFFIKKVVYQFLIRMAVDINWHQELASFSSLKNKQASFFKLICKEIELCAFFLYQISVKSFYNLIESQQPGNFLQQSNSSMPLPVRTMRFPSLFMSLSQKQIFNDGFSMFSNKNMSLKNSKSNNNNNQNDKNQSNTSILKFDSSYSWSDQEEEIFQQYQLLIQQDPLNLIHKNFQFAQLSKIITQYMNSSYDKAEKSMIKIVQKLRLKVIGNRKKHYQQIREKVIQKKYILTKEHQILQGVVFLRSNEERKLVGITKRMLQIYMDILAQNQVNASEDMVNLISKREEIKKRNTQNLSRKYTNKSVVSRVSSSIPSETQSSSSGNSKQSSSSEDSKLKKRK